MKKNIVVVATLIAISFTGCINNQPRMEYNTYKASKKSVIATRDIIKVDGGRLQFKDKNIMDEDGDIDMAFTIEGKVYYFTSKEDTRLGTYILKDENKKEIKKFEGKLVKLLMDPSGFPIILVQKDSRKINQLYDNVYQFNGKDVILVNKNLQKHWNEFYMAGYQVTMRTHKEGGFSGSYFPIVSVVDNTEIRLKTLHPDTFLGKPEPEELSILTSSGENIIYIYTDFNGDSAIEAFNLKSKEANTLAKGDVYCQLLYSGNKKILRIFNNKNIHSESAIHGYIPISKYDNESSIYIDLGSLNEVSININDFKKYIMKSGFNNMAGGYTEQNYVTFSLLNLKYHSKGRPLL